MSGMSEISVTWRDVMDDLTDSYFNYDPNDFLALATYRGARIVMKTQQDGITESRLLYDTRASARTVMKAQQNGISEALLCDTRAGDDEDGQRGSNRPSNASVEDSSSDSVNEIGSAIGGKAPRPPRPEKTQKCMAGDQSARLVIETLQNGISEALLLYATRAGDDVDGQRGSNRPSNASVEDSSSDSVNQIVSAIGGKAPQPRRPEKTPQARRQSVTNFITSIFKYKKMVNFGGAVRKLPAGLDSFEPRPTTLSLARIFLYEELKEATNSFEQQIGEGGFSIVYLGKLQDGRKVAVKVLYEGIPRRFEQFINEVTVLSRLRHQNLVSLYGCTDPETHKLLIVYQFVPNGTLASHLHGQRPPLSWALRIKIAIETAMALVYLHSLEPPIIHRDVKTSNILLDNDFHPKVADFGMCRLVPWDTTSVSTQPQGTVGYRDPEYDLKCKLTDKSDVYSFGVVLLEIISGKMAVDVNREESEIYLFRMALSKILNKELEQLVDSRLGYNSESEIGRMINSVAELACVCLQSEANKRPTMAEVLIILNGIKGGIQ